eukprot:277386_1
MATTILDDLIDIFDSVSDESDRPPRAHLEINDEMMIEICCDTARLKEFWDQNKAQLTPKDAHFLCIVCQHADVDGLQYVIENGGKQYLNTKPHGDGQYPFDTIAQQNLKDRMFYLIRNGAQMGADTMEHLFNAHKDIFKEYCLQTKFYDVPKECRLKFREYAFRVFAFEKNAMEKHSILIDNGVPPLPRHVSEILLHHPDTNICELFLKNFDLNDPSNRVNTETLLHLCCKYIDSNAVRNVRLLLQHGADPTITNTDEHTPLDILNKKMKTTTDKGKRMIRKMIQEFKKHELGDNYNYYVPDDGVPRWKCVQCQCPSNLFSVIECKHCGVTRIVDLTNFEYFIQIGAIGSVLLKMVDCIALNSLLQLNVVTLSHINDTMDKASRIKKYIDEMDDRLIKTTKTIFDNIHNSFCIQKVTMSVVDEKADRLRRMRAMMAKTIDNSEEMERALRALFPEQTRTSSVYPVNMKFSPNDDQSIRLALLSLLWKNHDASGDMRSVSKVVGLGRFFQDNCKWSFSKLLDGWCNVFKKQDLNPLNQGMVTKNTFENVLMQDEDGERVISIKISQCEDIYKTFQNQETNVNTQDTAESIKEMYVGQMVSNGSMNDEIGYELNPNILKQISQKVILEHLLRDIVPKWFVIDDKDIRRETGYENIHYRNHFYGVLNTKECIGCDGKIESYEIEFIKCTIGYYYNYAS